MTTTAVGPAAVQHQCSTSTSVYTVNTSRLVSSL